MMKPVRSSTSSRKKSCTGWVKPGMVTSEHVLVPCTHNAIQAVDSLKRRGLGGCHPMQEACKTPLPCHMQSSIMQIACESSLQIELRQRL